MSTTIVAHLLQSTLFAMLIALFVHAFRASAARVRYWLWLAASVKFLVPLSWLALLVQIAFWFHPLVWWIGRKLLQERERACDEAVLDAGHDRVAYATAIVDVCRQLSARRVMCVAGVSGSDLSQRIEDILSTRLGTSPSTVTTGVLVVGVVMIAALSSLLGSPSSATALSRDEPAPALQLSEVLLRPNRSTRPPWIGTIDGKLTLLNVPLKTVIAMAHGTGYRPVVDGPAWLDLGYDVQVSGNYPAFDPRSNHTLTSHILRQMVDDKLRVTGKLESRELGVFVMRVAPEGLNPLVFRPYVPSDAGAKKRVWPATMPQIASVLGRQLKHVVVDRTGLTETYDFHPHLVKVALHRATPETVPTDVRKIGLQLEFVIEPIDVFAIVSVIQPVANWKSESG